VLLCLYRPHCPIGFAEERTRRTVWNEEELETLSETDCQGFIPLDQHPNWLGRPCGHGRIPVELFRTCHQLREECETILYGENNFYIGCYSPGAYNIVCGLRTSALQNIRGLDVLIDRQNINWQEENPELTPLQQARVWYDLCALLATRLRPNTTSLGVYFRMRCINDAELIMSRLRTVNMPALRDLNFSKEWPRADIDLAQLNYDLAQANDDPIRIVNNLLARDRPLQSIYRSTAMKLMQPTGHSFPLQRLPVELQTTLLSTLGVEQGQVDLNISDASGVCGGQISLSDGLVPSCCGWCGGRMAICLCVRALGFSTRCVCASREVFLGRTGAYHDYGEAFVDAARRLYCSRNRFLVEIYEEHPRLDGSANKRELDIARAMVDFERIPSRYRGLVTSLVIRHGGLGNPFQRRQDGWGDLIRLIGRTFANPRLLVTIIIEASGLYEEDAIRDKRFVELVVAKVKKSSVRHVRIIARSCKEHTWGWLTEEQVAFRRG
jgi:hypothetical protein